MLGFYSVKATFNDGSTYNFFFVGSITMKDLMEAGVTNLEILGGI